MRFPVGSLARLKPEHPDVFLIHTQTKEIFTLTHQMTFKITREEQNYVVCDVMGQDAKDLNLLKKVLVLQESPIDIGEII